MLTEAPTKELVNTWHETALEYRPRLKPNRRTGAELMAFLTRNYPVIPIDDPDAAELVTDSVLQNPPMAAKLKDGETPAPKAFFIERAGTGLELYKAQEAVYEDIDIFVGIDLTTGYFTVEGSGLLWDRLFAHRGMDEEDILNDYLVYEYVSCLKRFGLIDLVLA